MAVTSNLHPSGFDTIMPKTLATATVDRLLHHAHVVLTEGASYRLAEATAGRGWCRSADRHGRSRCPPRGDHVSAEREIRVSAQEEIPLSLDSGIHASWAAAIAGELTVEVRSVYPAQHRSDV